MYNRLFRRGDSYRAPDVVRDARAESRGLLGALGLPSTAVMDGARSAQWTAHQHLMRNVFR